MGHVFVNLFRDIAGHIVPVDEEGIEEVIPLFAAAEAEALLRRVFAMLFHVCLVGVLIEGCGGFVNSRCKPVYLEFQHCHSRHADREEPVACKKFLLELGLQYQVVCQVISAVRSVHFVAHTDRIGNLQDRPCLSHFADNVVVLGEYLRLESSCIDKRRAHTQPETVLLEIIICKGFECCHIGIFRLRHLGKGLHHFLDVGWCLWVKAPVFQFGSTSVLICHVKHAVGGEVVGDDDHLVGIAVIVTKHRVPFTRLLIKIGGITFSGYGDADFHHTLEVVHTFEVEVIGGHIVHAILKPCRHRGIIDAVDGEGLCALNGRGTKLNTVVDHIDGIRLLIHLEGTLFCSRCLGF